MKKSLLFASAAMVLGLTAMASADPFSDVPRSHWAYDAVNSLAAKGLIDGYPDSTFKGKQNVTRYQLAMITARLVANLETMRNNSGVTKEDLKAIENLTVEFADELALLGVKITALEDDMQVVKEDVANLKTDVADMKKVMDDGGLENVKLSGDILIRHYDFNQKHRNHNEHRMETNLRLQFDAKIDENITARARWNLIENKHYYDADGKLLGGTNEWNGGNKGTGSVEVAYLQVKNAFGTNGLTIKLGRDWESHGHGLVVHDYMDGVRVYKRCGDVDLAFNVFYDRNNDVYGADYRNIWNINADYKYKSHNLYVGVYYNSYDLGKKQIENPITGSMVEGHPKGKATRVEFGSSGRISGNNDKFTYDVAGVYSKVEKIKPVLKGDRLALSDQSGWLAHAALNYDDHEQFNAKVAYTMADDESIADIARRDDNRWCMGDESIFEDLHWINFFNEDNCLNGMTINNIQDIKLQLGYTFKNANKHSVRFAFDMVSEKDSKKTIAHTGAPGKIDMKVLTFEYAYRMTENTRFRLGYQNAKDDKGTLVEKNCEQSILYTELFSKF